jgi:hypothetical protein
VLPIFKIGTAEKRISSLGIFQSGVKPMWEDDVNKGGMEIRARIPGNLVWFTINQIWEDVVVDLITKKIPNSD